MNAHRLILFTKHPTPGRAKTRLIPRLGPEGAARLHERMTARVLGVARRLAAQGSAALEVRVDGGDRAAMARLFGPDLPYRPQGPGDLGRRLQRAFAAAFAEGAARVVVIGADCPEITVGLLEEAFRRLDAHDLVVGPATDGGYYLIGLRRPADRLFADVPWGGPRVLDVTLRRAESLSLPVVLLPTLSDVDRPDDLAVWRRVQRAEASPRLSVIIPTFQEARCLPACLASLAAAVNVETLVADGGSRDGGPAIARRAGCRVLQADPPRASQMNAGAAAATGELLLFLHADTRLPPDFDDEVRRAAARPGFALGAFRLRIDSPRRAFRLIEWGVQLRARCLRLPYGDQALFLRADTFHSLGGFPRLPLLEDVELVRRVRRLGRLVLLDAAAVTSPRRWRRLGLVRTTWVNQKVIAAYWLGANPQRLARWYWSADAHGPPAAGE